MAAIVAGSGGRGCQDWRHLINVADRPWDSLNGGSRWGKRLPRVEGAASVEQHGWWQNRRLGMERGHDVGTSWRLGCGWDGGGRLDGASAESIIGGEMIR